MDAKVYNIFHFPNKMYFRELFKIGVNFSADTRNIEKWLVEN